ncbi:MAG: hypothetical protein R6T91_06005 [Bacteroidales bacterium]
MKIQKLLIITSAVALIGFTACEKDTIDNDSSEQATVELKFETVNSGFPLKNTNENQLEFASGHIILESAEFEISSDNDSTEMEFEIESYITIDFATGNTDPDITAIELTPGTYSEIEVELELWDETDEPAILLEGSWTDSSGFAKDIRLEYYSGQDFEYEREGNIIIDENTSLIAYITFDPNIWFSTVTYEELNSATTDENGVLVISPDQNSGIYEKVEEAMDEVSEVEIDDDDDDDDDDD